MKRKIFSYLLSATMLLAGVGVIGLSSGSNEVCEAEATATHVKSSFKNIHDSIVESTVEYATLDENATYNLGDGSLATFKASKGDSSETPKIRRYSGGTKYYMYLKYNKSYANDSVGGYLEINAASGKALNKITWDSIKSYDVNKVGYQIQVLDLKTGKYTVERSVAPSSYDSPDITFAKQTPSARIYQWIPTSATGHEYFSILDISAYVDDAQYKTITFDSKGGTDVATAYYFSDEVTVAPTAPTKATEGATSYTFAGWYTDPECTEGNEYSFGGTLSSNITLYAKWNSQTISGYTLTFVTNSSYVIEPQVAEIGTKFTKPDTNPTKDADAKYTYEFANWFADEDLSTPFDFDTVYTSDKTCYAGYKTAISSIAGATTISMKTDIKKYGASWSSDNYEDHVLNGKDVNSSMVDSTFTFSKYKNGNYGIKRAGADKYDVYMKYCTVTWELNDYSKYISTVEWDLKNTGYVYNKTYVVRMYANKTATGTEVDSDHLILGSWGGIRSVMMAGNTDETINAVSFKQDNVSFNYGFENIRYILGDASDAQQTVNFSKAFIEQMTCDGVDSITAAEGTWTTFASRIATMSANAKTILAGDTSEDTTVKAALARYDFIIRKYGTSQYSDFLNRFGGEYNPALPTALNSNTASNTPIFVVIAAVAACSLGALLFIKRRKENN